MQNATELNDKTVENFHSILTLFFKEKVEEFKNVLQRQKAIISGGSVARALFNEDDLNWKISDLDIYVQAKDFIPLRDYFLDNSKRVEIIFQGNNNTGYSYNFFKKNKIIKLYRFHIDNFLHIDLMMVKNSQPLTEVVMNFDLSCCKVFYDGENIYGWNIQKILKKEAELNKDYLECLHLKTRTTINRIKKYNSRGFSICIPFDASPKPILPIITDEEYSINNFWFMIFDIMMNNKSRVPFHKIIDFRNISNNFSKKFEKDEKLLKKLESQNYILSLVSFEDGFDKDEFMSPESYETINRLKEFKKICKVLLELFISKRDFYLSYMVHPIKKYDIDIFIKLLDKYSSIKTIRTDIPDISCFSEVDFAEIPIREFLDEPENIVIRFKGNLKGYNRNNLHKYCIEKGRLYGGEVIQESHTFFLLDENIQCFELLDSGIEKYHLIPYSTVMFFK